MFDFFDYEDYDYYVADDEEKLSPLIAAGTKGPGWGWWAKGQLRSERKGHEGEWVEMGRTNRWKQRDKSGKISDGYGVYIGPSDIKDHGRFLVSDKNGKPLYVIHVPNTKFEPVKGLISEEYLQSIGIKTEGLDAKEEDVVDLETARKDPVTDDDIKLASSKMPKMPNLRKMVEGRTETNIPHSSLKDGDIVSDGKRFGLVADVKSENGKIQAFVRWEDGQITQTVPADPGKMTKAWPKAKPIIKKSVSKNTVKGKDLKVGDVIRAWDEDRIIKSIEPGSRGDRYVTFETPGEDEDDAKLININDDVELASPKEEKPVEQVKPVKPVETEKPDQIKASELKKGSKIVYSGEHVTVKSIGKPDSLTNAFDVVLENDLGVKQTVSLEPDDVFPIADKKTKGATPAQQLPPALARAKKKYPSEIEPGDVLLHPKTGEEVGIILDVYALDKNDRPLESVKANDAVSYAIRFQKADGTVAGVTTKVKGMTSDPANMLRLASTPNGRLAENRFNQITPENVQKFGVKKKSRVVEDVSEEEAVAPAKTPAAKKQPVVEPSAGVEIPESIQVIGGKGKISQAQADLILHKLKEAQGSVPDAVVKKILKGVTGGAQSTGFNYIKELDSYILPLRMQQGLPIDDLMIPHDEETVAKVAEYIKSQSPESNISGDINTTGPLTSRLRFIVNDNGEISLVGYFDKERANLFRDFGFEYDATAGVSQFKRTIDDKDERAAVLQDLFNAINFPAANFPHKSKPIERKTKAQKEKKTFPQPESAAAGDSGDLTDRIQYSIDENGNIRLDYSFVTWDNLKEAVQRLRDAGTITKDSPNPKPVANEKAAILSVKPSTGVSGEAARLALLKEIQNVIAGKEAEKSSEPVVESTNDTGAPISGSPDTAGVLSGDVKYSVSGGGKITISGLSNAQTNAVVKLIAKLEAENGFEVTQDFEDDEVQLTVFSPSGEGKFSDDRSKILTEIRNALGEQEPATEEPKTEEEPATEEPATEEPQQEEPQQEEPATEEPATEEPVTDEQKLVDAIKKETRYETLMDGDTDFDTAQTLIRSLSKRHKVSEDFIRELLEKDGFKMPEKTETPVKKVSRNQPGRGHKKVSGTYGDLKPIDIIESKAEPGVFARVLGVKQNPNDPNSVDIKLLMEDNTEQIATRPKNAPLEFYKSEVTDAMLKSVIRRVWGTEHIPKGGLLSPKETKKIKKDLKNMTKAEILDLIEKLDAEEFKWRMKNGLPIDDLIQRRKDRLGDAWVSPQLKELLDQINSYEPSKNLDGSPIEKKEEPATEEPQQEKPAVEEPQQEEPAQEEEETPGQKDASTDAAAIAEALRADVPADIEKTVAEAEPSSVSRRTPHIVTFNKNPDNNFASEGKNEMAGGTARVGFKKNDDGSVEYIVDIFTSNGGFDGSRSTHNTLDEAIQEAADRLAKYNSSLPKEQATGGWVRPQQTVPAAEDATLDFTPVDPKKSRTISAGDLKVGDKVHDTMSGDWAEVLEVSEDPGAPGRINVVLKTKDGKVETSYKKRTEVLVYREEEPKAEDTTSEETTAEAEPGDNQPTPEKKPKPGRKPKPKPEEDAGEPAEKVETYKPVIIPEGSRIGYRNPVPAKDLKEGDIIDRAGESWIIRKIERVQNSNKDVREARRKGKYLPKDSFKFTLSRLEDNITETHEYGRTLLVKKLTIEPDPHAPGFKPREVKVPKTFPRADLTKRDLKKMLKAARTEEERQQVLDLMETMKSLNEYKKRNPGALDPKIKPLPLEEGSDGYKGKFSLHLDALGMDAGDKMALESWLKDLPIEIAARHRVDFMEANPLKKTEEGTPDPKQTTNIEKSIAKIKKAISERDAPPIRGESRFKAKVGQVTIDGVRELFGRDLEEYEQSNGKSKDPDAWSLDGRYTPNPETEDGVNHFKEQYVKQMYGKSVDEMTESERKRAWDQFVRDCAASEAQETRFRVLQVEGTSAFIRFRDGHNVSSIEIQDLARQLQELELFSDIGGVVKHITLSSANTFTIGRTFMSNEKGSNNTLDGFTVVTENGIFIQLDPRLTTRERSGKRMPIPKSGIKSKDNALVETMTHEYFHAFAGLILGEAYNDTMSDSDIIKEFRKLFPELGEDHPISAYAGSSYEESFAEYASAMFRYVVNKLELPNANSEKRLLDFINFFDKYAKNDIHPSAQQDILRGSNMPILKRAVSDRPSFPKSVNGGHDSELLAEYEARRPFYENLLNPFGAPLDATHRPLIASYVGLINQARADYDENGGQDRLSRLVGLIHVLKQSYDGHVFAYASYITRQRQEVVRGRISSKDDTKSYRAWSSKEPFVSIPGDNSSKSSYKNELSVGSYVDENGETRLLAYVRSEKSKGDGAGRESLFVFVSEPGATFESFIENSTFDDFKRGSAGYFEAGQFEDDSKFKDDGLEVKTVFVNKEQRRLGLATAMLEFARQNSKKNVLHSNNYTKQVDAWARSVDINPDNHTGTVKFADTYDVIRQSQAGAPILKKMTSGEINWRDGTEFEHYENLPITYSDPLIREQFTPEQIAALRDYGFSGYKVLEADPASLSEDQRTRAETIRTQLAAAMLNPASRLPRHMYLYHGAVGKPGDSVHNMFFGKKEGDIINASSFVSTSMSPTIAHEYFGPGVASDISGQEGFFVTIKAPQGCAGIIMPEGITARDEREVLLDSNAQFRVTGVNRTNRFTEDGEEVPGAFDTQLEVELIPSEVQSVELPESKRDLQSEDLSYAVGSSYGDSLFARLQDVTVEGDGGLGPKNSAVGYVSSDLLFSMAGNPVPNDDSLAKHVKELEDGVGFKNPVTVLYNPKTKQAVLIDGNHRVKAAVQTGTSHVPTIVKTTSEDLSKHEKIQVLDGETGPNSFYSKWPEIVNPYFVFGQNQMINKVNIKSTPIMKKMITEKGIHSSRMRPGDDSTAGRRAKNLMPQGDGPEDRFIPGRIVQMGPDGQIGVVVKHEDEVYTITTPDGEQESRVRLTGKVIVRVLDGIIDDMDQGRTEAKRDANGRRREVVGSSSEAGGYNDKRQYTEHTVDSAILTDVTDGFTKSGTSPLQIQDTMFGNITQAEGEPIYGRIAGYPRPGFIKLAELTGLDEYGMGIYTYHEVPVSRFSPIQNRRESADKSQILEHSGDMRANVEQVDDILNRLKTLFRRGWISEGRFQAYRNQIRAGFITKSGANEISKLLADAESHANTMYDIREDQQPVRGKSQKPQIKGKPAQQGNNSPIPPKEQIGTPDFVVNPPQNKGRMTVSELIAFKKSQGASRSPILKKMSSPISGPTPDRDTPVETESRVTSNPPSEIQLREIEMGLYEEGVLSPTRAQEIHDALPFMDAETIKVIADEVNSKLLDKRVANNEPVDGINIPKGYNTSKLIGYEPTKYVDGAPITKKSVSEDEEVRAMIEEAAQQGDFSLSEEQINVIYSLLTSNRSSVILGKAGTGKSTIIDFVLKHTDKRSVVLAPTATAAENVGGDTIHRFFGFPPAKVLNALPDFVEKYSQGPMAAKLKALDLLVIDEVSMVSADLIDAIDRALRLANNNMYTPFGGKQVVFVGDNRQLPVIDFKFWEPTYDENGALTGYERSPETEAAQFMERKYKSSAWFDSNVFTDEPIEVAELQEVFRQKDEDFKKDLNKIRDAKISQDDLIRFNQTYIADPDMDPLAEGFTVIANTRKDVKRWNDLGLSRVPGAEISIPSEAPKNIDPRDRGRKEELDLVVKIGARIQFTKNDDATQRKAAGAPSKKGQARRWKNGDHGTLVGWDPTTRIAEVKLEKTGQTVFVAFAAHDTLKYELVQRADRAMGSRDALNQEVQSTIMALPMTLGYAQTVHRAQGQTLDKVYYDLGEKNAFSYGQVYVALSRVRDPKNLRISRPIKKDEIFDNPDITKFEQDLHSRTGGERSDLDQVRTGTVPAGKTVSNPVIKKAVSPLEDNKDVDEKIIMQRVTPELHANAKRILNYRTKKIDNMPDGWSTSNPIDDSSLQIGYDNIDIFYNDIEQIFNKNTDDLSLQQKLLVNLVLRHGGVDIYKHVGSGTTIRRYHSEDPSIKATDDHVRRVASAHKKILDSGKTIDGGSMDIDLVDPNRVGAGEADGRGEVGAQYLPGSGKINIFTHRLDTWDDNLWSKLTPDELFTFILAHEYGHKLDHELMKYAGYDEPPSFSSYIEDLIKAGMANRAKNLKRKYALENELEYTAESYAGWVMKDTLNKLGLSDQEFMDTSLVEKLADAIAKKNSRVRGQKLTYAERNERQEAKKRHDEIMARIVQKKEEEQKKAENEK